MTIASTYAPLTYTGNGSQTAFTVTFIFNTASDLQVYVDDVLQVLTTDYTVSGGGSVQAATGTVTFVTAPEDDTEIVIKRNLSRVQSSDYVDNSKLPAAVLERNLDRLTMMVQEIDYISINNQGEQGEQGDPGGPLADGDMGDIVVSGSGTVFTIDAGVVGTSKLGGNITTAGKALLDDASASDQRTTLGLGTLATQSGTFSGTSSGTNTGDQSLFSTIAVSGQSNVVADATTDTLTLAAGSNITITTDASTDTVTIASSGGTSDWVKISTTNLASASSLVYTSLSMATYKYYVIKIIGMTPATTSGVSLLLTTSSNGGSSYAATDYYYGVTEGNTNTNVNSYRRGVPGTSINLVNSTGLTGDATQFSEWEIQVFSSGVSSIAPTFKWTACYFDHDFSVVNSIGAGVGAGTTAMDAIKLVCGSGNFSTGTAILYGVK